jgi:hypothetical protein
VHLYVDKGRYWYSLKATVSRLARERAEQLKETPETKAEIVRLLRAEKEKGEFGGIHVYADKDDQVDESFDARLVLIGPDWNHSRKKTDSSALKIAEQILTMRGNSPRIHRNTLVFLAADAKALGDLDEAVRHYLAWKSIRDEAEKEALDLSKFAKAQAKTKTEEYERACKVRLMETWAWGLVPTQPDPMTPGIVWEEVSVSGGDALAPKLSRKLVDQENLLPVLGAPRLKMELDRYLWKSDPHVNLKQVADCFSTYLYLPRLTRRDVLVKAVQNAFAGTLLCEFFAYASGYDDASKRYSGLQTTRLNTSIQIDGSSLLVKPEPAMAQVEADKPKPTEPAETTQGGILNDGPTPAGGGVPPPVVQAPAPKTIYYGSKSLTPTRASLDFSDIQKEIIQHFVSKLGVEVEVSVEITAKYPSGFDQNIIRTVSENAAVLKLDESGFSS